MKAVLSYIIFLLLVSSYASSQPLFDVRHYNIRLDLSDTASESLQGCCTVTVQSETNGLQQVVFSLLTLQVDGITIHQNAAAYTYNDTTLIIQLPATLNQGDSVNIEICYHGEPSQDESWGGFYFSGSYAFNIGVAFTSEPHNFGRVWFPCVDNFTDRATYEFHITTAASQKAFCNGLPQGFTQNTDGTVTWHWRMNQTIPTYLASVAVADYASLEGQYPLLSGDSVPYMLAAQPVDTNNLKNSFIHLPDALTGFEECFGHYLFDRVGFVLVPFSGGAMEHATNVAYPRFAVTGGLQYETLMAHEFSHHWFGNLVTCETPEEMWLNEGWARYSEFVFMEKVYGEDAYRQEARKNHKKVLQYTHIRDDGYRAVSGVSHEYTYGSTVYDKGGDVAHTLRAYLGDSLFFACIADYLDAFKFSHANSHDFQNHLSQCSGVDLTAFFDNWVFAPGFPHFSIDSFFVTPNAGVFDVTVFIRQRLKEAPALFSNVPLEITFFKDDFGSVTRQVLFSGSCGIHHATLDFQPVYVALDFDEKISDAITGNHHAILNAGNYIFEEAMMTLMVTVAPSPVFVRVEHNWLSPDPLKSDIPGVHISNEHYWKVDGIIPDGFAASARIIFDGTAANGFLDQELITNSEDSLVIFFRPDTRSDWTLFPDIVINTQGNPNNASGQIIINNISKGEFALGIRDAARQPRDMQTVTLPCAVLNIENGVSKNGAMDFHIYPNPAGDSFFIRFDAPVKEMSLVVVYSLSGKKIKEIAVTHGEAELNIPVSGWNKSTYLVSVSDAKGRNVKRVVVLD